MVKLVDLFEVISERYSERNTALLRYMKEKPIDLYRYWHHFREWFENQDYYLDGNFELLLSKMGIDEVEFQENPEYMYDLPDGILGDFEEAVKDRYVSDDMYHNPVDAPTWAHGDLRKDQLIPRTEWLVHFSDHADDIARQGFIYGMDDMDRLGLTTYFKKEAKTGGYNFAFTANSWEANQVADSTKYGKHAVLFQNSGVMIDHYGDQEDQVIFHGEDVDPRNIVYLENDYGDWIVKPHPTKYRKEGQETKGGGVFKGDFQTCVAWVIKNYRQYAKIITGW